MGALVEVCSRCKREAPPAIMGAEGRAAQGWVVFEDDDGCQLALVCPGCRNDTEHDSLSPDTLPEEWRDTLPKEED